MKVCLMNVSPATISSATNNVKMLAVFSQAVCCLLVETAFLIAWAMVLMICRRKHKHHMVPKSLRCSFC